MGRPVDDEVSLLSKNSSVNWDQTKLDAKSFSALLMAPRGTIKNADDGRHPCRVFGVAWLTYGFGFPMARLIPLMVFTVDGEPSIFIPRRTSGPTLSELVFPLYELSLCGGNVGRESEQEVVGNSLLHRDTGARIGVVAA